MEEDVKKLGFGGVVPGVYDASILFLYYLSSTLPLPHGSASW